MNFRRVPPEDVGFQMAPMIDIIFTLLLFYVVTSAMQQTEKEISVSLPQTEEGALSETGSDEIIVNVSESGEITMYREVLTLDVLREKLSQLVDLYRVPGILQVVVRGDKNTAYGRVVEVLDICSQVNISKVSFVSTDKEP
jgi:biopolymer transport protein ExbD